MNDQLRDFLQALSYLFGWIYFLSWSLSFYPQPLLNWRRRSTRGLSIDFPFLNVIGFVCYIVSIIALLYSPTIRSQYAQRHPHSPEPTVRFNDFAFGAHAMVLTSVTYSQFFPKLWRFDVAKSQRVSRPVAAIAGLCALAVLVVIALVLFHNDDSHDGSLPWAWIDVIYTIGDVKLVATLVKYTPQVIFNYQRQSTKGWSIDQILFDFAGGVLSTLQLFIDASLQSDWSGIAGNPVKLGLGLISVFYDVVFMVQHYLLYTNRSTTTGIGNDDNDINDNSNDNDEYRPLVANS